MTLINEVQARQLPPVSMRRAIRLSAGVSQLRMAQELGVHRLTFVRWEKGKHDPRGDRRTSYAALLGQLQQVSTGAPTFRTCASEDGRTARPVTLLNPV